MFEQTKVSGKNVGGGWKGWNEDQLTFQRRSTKHYAAYSLFWMTRTKRESSDHSVISQLDTNMLSRISCEAFLA
jgi:hypothetical protein